MSAISELRARTIVARATTRIAERPDRLARAWWASRPYGSTMLGAVAAARARYPDATAIACEDRRLSYAALWAGSDALARGLLAAGVGAGDRIGLLCRNSPLFPLAMLAGAKLGTDLVFLNTGLAGPQLAEVAAAEQLTAVVHDDEFDDQIAACPIECAISATAAHGLIGSPPGPPLRPPARQSGLVILTSGTTGQPKGAVRATGDSSHAGIAALLGRIPIRVRDTVVVPAPFFHAWGLAHLLITLALSGTVVVRPEFDPDLTLRDVAGHRARVLVTVPAMLQRVCALDPHVLAASDTGSLRVIASSGSALPGRLASEVIDRFGPVLYNVYGSTEVATATVATPADLRRSPATAGRPAPGVRMEVLDQEGRPVPPGTTGRVFVGNAARFDGYTGGGGKETVRGLLSTGDLGHFDTKGCLHIDGREDDMIVSGGENVYPAEVEDLLGHHPDIAEAAVVGVPDERFGQALKAIVVLKPGRHPDADAIKEYVRTRLARYKVPRTIEFLDELPRNATGKVLRRRLT